MQVTFYARYKNGPSKNQLRGKIGVGTTEKLLVPRFIKFLWE